MSEKAKMFLYDPATAVITPIEPPQYVAIVAELAEALRSSIRLMEQDLVQIKGTIYMTSHVKRLVRELQKVVDSSCDQVSLGFAIKPFHTLALEFVHYAYLAVLLPCLLVGSSFAVGDERPEHLDSHTLLWQLLPDVDHQVWSVVGAVPLEQVDKGLSGGESTSESGDGTGCLVSPEYVVCDREGDQTTYRRSDDRHDESIWHDDEVLVSIYWVNYLLSILFFGWLFRQRWMWPILRKLKLLWV